MKRETRAAEVIESFVRAVCAEMRGGFAEDEPGPGRQDRTTTEPIVNVWWSPRSTLAN